MPDLLPITDTEIDDVIKVAPEGVALDPAKTQGRNHRSLIKRVRDYFAQELGKKLDKDTNGNIRAGQSTFGAVYSGYIANPSLFGDYNAYIGFNVERFQDTDTVWKWRTRTDSVRNGAVLWVVDSGGILKIANIGTTGTTARILTDTDMLALLKDMPSNPEAFAALTIGATTTWATGGKYVNNKILTLTQNTTIALTGLVNSAEGSLVVIQDATGSRTLALPAGSLPTSIFIQTAANSVTFLGWKYDGTRIFWTAKEY